MFDSQTTSDKDLKFDVAAPPRWEFSPGDTIIGHLVRKSHIVAAEATIRLTLTGRIKTTITQNDRNGLQMPDSKRWTDEFDIIEPIQEIIFRGPLHLPENSEGSLSWPFSVTLPTQRARPPNRHYISKHGFSPPPAGLPGSFSASGHSIRLFSHGSVKYTLNARMHYKRGDSHIVHHANCPITLRHPTSISDPTQLRSLVTRTSPDLKVQSQRLQPGMETSELSFKQKTLKLVGSSKVPEFHYNLIVSAPNVAQLDNPEPFPLVLKVKSLPEKISPSIREFTQTIHIDSISAALVCKTGFLAPTQYSDQPYGDGQERSHDLGLWKMFDDLETPLAISTGKGSDSIDIGNVFQLVLHSNGLSAGKRDLFLWVTTIYPDFDAYTIRHTHDLELKVRVSVAGESQTFKTRTPFKIIAAS